MIIALGSYSQTITGENMPLAPEQYRRPSDWKPVNYKYSLLELRDKFSEDLIKRAAAKRESVNDVNRIGKWKPTIESINSHSVPEWFLDAKFGMFIDWGLWSLAGWAPPPEKNASWLDQKRIYPDWYEFNLYYGFSEYHKKNWGIDFRRDDFIPLFKAENYHPDKLVDLAVESGVKYII